MRHNDPFAAQVARAAQAETSAPATALAPQLVEKSAILNGADVFNVAVRVPVILGAPTPEPCSCPADRELAPFEAV
jgi:hypothetical protein